MDNPQEKKSSDKEDIFEKIAKCPSDKVRKALLDSLNKENNTADTDG